MAFLEEFIKRNQGNKNAQDKFAFSELAQDDQVRIAEVLQKEGNYYKFGAR